MKSLSLYFKRGLALVLAMALVLSCSNLGLALSVFANDGEAVTKTDGQIVAENYELSDAEEALIGSGLLVGETHTYTVPADSNLISVNSETKEITASNYENWVPVSADIVVSGAVYETVALADGLGSYTYDGNAFAVKVTYKLNISVDEEIQATLMTAGGIMADGLAVLDNVADQSGKLGLVEMAMPELVELAKTNYVVNGATFCLSDAGKAAIAVMDAQMKANGDKLDLSADIANYQAGSGIKYLLTAGNDMLADAKALNEQLIILEEALNTLSGLSPVLVQLGAMTAKQADQLKTLSKTVTDLSVALDTVPENVEAATKGTALVKAEITDAEYLKLDTLVAKLEGTTEVAIQNPLLFAETSVQYNMSMFDVTVTVALEKIEDVVGSTNILPYDSKSAVITLADGASAEEILAAVQESGIEEAALLAWAGIYDAEHFEATATELPDALTGDLEYVITYAPKSYNVTLGYGEALMVPYGYQLLLEKSTVTNQVYDYTVNGTYIPEGSTVVIEGDTTIERKTGKPYTNYDLYTLVSTQYGTDKEDSVLLAGALKGNVAVNVRYPENTNNTLTDIDNVTLTAYGYDSSYKGLVWVPYTYSIDGGAAVKFGEATGNNVWVVTLNAADFSSVTVVYRLALTNLEGKALEALNLPAELVTEAMEQKSALDSIGAKTYMDNMAQLDRTKLGALNGVIDVTDLCVETDAEGNVIKDENGSPIVKDAAKNAELKAYFKGVVSEVITKCLSGNTLTIYGLLSEYNTQGLGYYYANSEKFIAEIDLISGYLTAMLADEEKVAALEILVGAAGYPEIADKIANLEGAMAYVKDALTAPNSIIDLNSGNLNKLCDALIAEGTVNSYDKLPAPFALETSFVLDSDFTKTLTTTVMIGGVEHTIIGDNLPNGEILSEANISKLMARIEEVAVNVNNVHYETNYNANALRAALTGKTALEAAEYLAAQVYTWTPVDYTVTVNGVQTVINVGGVVQLPTSPSAVHRYEYYIDGKQYAGSVTFTAEMIEKLFVNKAYTVELKIVDLGRETLVAFVDKVNASIGSNAITMALVENNGAYSIVLRVDASNTGALSNAAMGTVMGLVNGGYSYIGLDGNDVLFMNEENSLAISLQSIVDAVMNSGFGKKTVLEVIDANGNVKNMTLAGEIISNAKPASLGGKLIQTTMSLGNTAADAVEYPFYITLGGAPGALTTVRNALAGKAGNYVNFVLDEGKTNVDLTLPGKAYEAYLAALLVTNEIDLSDVGAVNAEIAYTFLMDLVEPALDESVTLDTYLNTLSKLGFDLSLGENKSLATKIYNTARDQYKKLTFTYDKVSGETTAHFGIKAILDKLAGDKADLLGMVKEYNTGLDITANLELTNLVTDYEALYIDISADGITNKAGFTTNLDSKSFAGASVIVLLQDVTADLELNGTSIVNLNGYTLTGNITGSGSVTVVDASFDGEGKLNGSYGDNVSVMPANDFYTLKRDENGDVVMSISADILAMRQMPSIKNLVIDVACDLLFNGYTSNKLYVGSNMVYELTVDDLVALYANDGKAAKAFEVLTNLIDDADLANIVNSVIADLTDFAAVQAAVENGTAVMSYEIITAPWVVEVEHITSGDYLTANIATGADKQTTFKVVVVGSEENKQLVADMLAVLAETTTVDVKLTASDYVNGSVWTHDWTASAAVAVDFTVNPDYAVMICTILADGLTGTNRTALVEGIKAVYAEKSTKKLEKAFNNLKVSDIITAIENIARNDSFEAMVNNLGLKGIVADSVYELADTCSLVAKVLGAAMRKLDIDRGSRLMSSFLRDGAYTADKSGFARSASANLFAGYSVAVNAEITDVSVSVKLFGEIEEVKDPAFVEGTGTPEVKIGGLIAGAHVVAAPEGGIIYIDAHVDGITVGQFLEQLTFYAENADTITVEVVGTEADALVVNGATVKAVASNNESEVTDEITYTVIVLGDVNCNGTNDVTDGSQMAQYWIGNLEFSDVSVLAYDINQDGSEDVADAVTLAEKWITDWEDYESHLNAQ